MVKSKVLFLLLSVYTALLATCGIEYRIGFVVAAAATATSVNTNRATCRPGSDQPHCNDPSYDHGDATVVDAEHQPMSSTTPTNTSIRGASKDRAFCDSRECGKQQQQHHRTTGGSALPVRFQSGDVIELYNTQSRDIQVVFPSLVKGRDPGPVGGYRVTKTTDGKEVNNIPDKHMHMYEPYQKGDEALCNIGEFKPARPIIVRCTVLEYEPAASRGAMVLQGIYSVQVHATKANEEYTSNLPVWKLQRRYQPRYLATG